MTTHYPVEPAPEDSSQLVAGPLAPLYRYDGRPVIRNGSHLCLPYPEAAAHNWDIIKDQGTIRRQDADGRLLSADEIRLELRGRGTSSLLGKASSSDLYFFNPIELLVVSADGDLLLMQRSNRGASEGMLNHFAGGFPKVVEGPKGPEAEKKMLTALRETFEELGVRILSAVDLNCATYDNTISPFVLATRDGGKRPGFTPEIMQRFGYHSPKSTMELLDSLTTKSDSVGMAMIRPQAFEAVMRGATKIPLLYARNTADFAQPFFEGAEQNGKLQLSVVRNELLTCPMTPAQRAQTGRYSLDLIEAEADMSVFYKPNIASGLAAFRAAQYRLSNEASAYLDKFRLESRAGIIAPTIMPSPRQSRGIDLAT